MREFQEKRKLRKIIFSKKMFFFLLLVLIFMFFSVAKVYFKSREALLKNEGIKKELAQLNEEKNKLESEINRLETEAGTEEEIRGKFDVLKPGEKVVVIVDKNQENDKINLSEKKGFLTKIMALIKNIF